MKKVLCLGLLFCLIVGVLSAAIPATQWETDYGLLQGYMNGSPKNYLAAISITKKWVDYAEQDATRVAELAGEGVTAELLTSSLNNIYREAAGVICNDFNSLMAQDSVKAAEFAINVQTFFRNNSVIFEEFAVANNSSVAAMKQTVDQAIKDGILKTYANAASEYSELSKAGKSAQAAALSDKWLRVVSDWNANNSPIPEAFSTFANVDPVKTTADLKAFEADLEAWRKAVSTGDEGAAFGLVEKWIKFEKDNPDQAKALQYIFGASSGTSATEATDWKSTFNTATYVQLWAHDLKAYKQAIAEGRLAEAIELIKKWEKVFAGEFAELICRELGFAKDSALKSLVAEKTKLENVDPKTASESVASFKVDLAEYYDSVKKITDAVKGSDEWYNALARATELADKWSLIAAENPALAAEIVIGTGIELPLASDDVIKEMLQRAVNDSAEKFNSALGTGKLAEALNIIKGWDDYLKSHKRTGQLAEEMWPGINGTLERYKKGLETMTGTDQEAEPVATQQSEQGTLGTSGN